MPSLEEQAQAPFEISLWDGRHHLGNVIVPFEHMAGATLLKWREDYFTFESVYVGGLNFNRVNMLVELPDK